MMDNHYPGDEDGGAGFGIVMLIIMVIGGLCTIFPPFALIIFALFIVGVGWVVTRVIFTLRYYILMSPEQQRKNAPKFDWIPFENTLEYQAGYKDAKDGRRKHYDPSISVHPLSESNWACGWKSDEERAYCLGYNEAKGIPGC